MEAAIKYKKQPIALKTLHNTRDLGGYETKDGGKTSDRFIRADCIMPMSEEDAEALLGLGVSTVIDFRSAAECGKVPSGLKDAEGITYIHLPFFSENNSFDYSRLPEDFTMGHLYVMILSKQHEVLCEFFRHVLAVNSGKILFHCSAGKDRTGVAAAILLLLAGVEEETVVEDFALTESFLAEVMPTLKANSGIPAMLNKLTDEMLSANPDNMRYMISHLHQQYGNVETYLTQIGLSDSEIAEIKHSMVTGERTNS